MDTVEGEEKESTCDICKFTTNYGNDVYSFGEWMQKQSITVHYFCLLLSTDLPQRGSDSAGILGFLIRDIRKEIRAAAERSCCFCLRPHASIACTTCRRYYHLSCGLDSSGCVFRFSGDFASYCEKCAPLDEYQRQLNQKPPRNVSCSICLKIIGLVVLSRVVYCDCCRKSFVHRICIQRFALYSGYYLRCIWCRSVEFRDCVRLQGIFVPDREAHWEMEKNAFSDHYRGHMRCDVDPCLCPKGRDYNRSSWSIVRCKLCASFGVHLKCGMIGNKEKNFGKDFKCPSCLLTEEKLKNCKISTGKFDEEVDASFYIVKQKPKDQSSSPISEGNVSDEASISSVSIITVIEGPKYVQKPSEDQHNCNDKAKAVPDNGALAENRMITDDVVLPLSGQDVQSNETRIITYNSPIEEQNNCKNKAKASTGNGTLAENNLVTESGELPTNKQNNVAIIEEKAILPRPLQLKSSYRYSNMPNYFFLEVYEMNATETDCIGTLVLRFSVTDPRLQDKSQSTFEQLVITEDDVHTRSSDRGVYAKLDKIMEEELNKLN